MGKDDRIIPTDDQPSAGAARSPVFNGEFEALVVNVTPDQLINNPALFVLTTFMSFICSSYIYELFGARCGI